MLGGGKSPSMHAELQLLEPCKQCKQSFLQLLLYNAPSIVWRIFSLLEGANLNFVTIYDIGDQKLSFFYINWSRIQTKREIP
jgi:hypothetical protein